MPDPSPIRRNAPLQTEYLAGTGRKPMPWAPRRHPPSPLRLLVKSLAAFGFNVPILADGDRSFAVLEREAAAASTIGAAR